MIPLPGGCPEYYLSTLDPLTGAVTYAGLLLILPDKVRSQVNSSLGGTAVAKAQVPEDKRALGGNPLRLSQIQE